MKTNLLSEKAMLVHLSISRWTARSKDRTAGEDISQQKKAEADVANVWVQLVPKDEMKEVYRSSGAIRKIWIKYTLPWMDEGIRILPSDLYVKFSGEVKKAITEDQKIVMEAEGELYELDIAPMNVMEEGNPLAEFLPPLGIPELMNDALQVFSNLDEEDE